MNSVTRKTLLKPINGTPKKRVFLSIIGDYGLKTGVCELIDNILDLWTMALRSAIAANGHQQESTMRRHFIPVILATVTLAGCVSNYTPNMPAAAQSNPNYASDLQACRAEAEAKKSANYWHALGSPAWSYFDSSNPSSIPGERLNVDNCMRARGYTVAE